MRIAAILFLLALAGCGGAAWNTTVADHPQVRSAMLASVHPGKTTEKRFTLQWGQPTQKQREGAQVAYIYRNMKNMPGYYAPQFGNSQAYVVVLFQYGLAVGAFSSDTEGCRATFPPRPPGPVFDNPSTVHAVNCGVIYDGSTEFRPIAEGIGWLADQARSAARRIETSSGGIPRFDMTKPDTPMVPEDVYSGGTLK